MSDLFKYDPTDDQPSETDILCEVLAQVTTIITKLQGSNDLKNIAATHTALIIADLEVLSAYVTERLALSPG